jgi:hypothetical protein
LTPRIAHDLQIGLQKQRKLFLALTRALIKAPRLNGRKIHICALNTLRSADYSSPTQDLLPAAGQALPDGLRTRKIPMKGFKVASLHLFLLSQASWHKHALLMELGMLSLAA